MSLDYNTVINACYFSIMGAVIAGVFGFFIGKILETSNVSKKNNKSNYSKKTVIKENEYPEEENLE